MKRLAPSRTAILLGGVLLATLLFSPAVGSVPIPPLDAAGVLLHQVTGGRFPANACPAPLVVQGTTDPCSVVIQIVWQGRIPEILLALLVGAALASAGGTMQGIFRNPLGDPYLLGISSGAALGAALLFVGGVGVTDANVILPFFAFGGAMLVAVVVLVASQSERSTTETLLLTGVALGSLFGAVITLLLSLSPSARILPLTFWILGGFNAASWTQVGIAFTGIAVGIALLSLHGRDLNLLQLGDETARGLGCDVRAVRRRLLLLASFVTAVAVAFSGIIAFVGLVSPHVVRRIQGPDYRNLIPLSALFGATFMLLADDGADSLLGGGGILPVGVITAFIGAPFFLWILYRRRAGAPA